MFAGPATVRTCECLACDRAHVAAMGSHGATSRPRVRVPRYERSLPACDLSHAPNCRTATGGPGERSAGDRGTHERSRPAPVDLASGLQQPKTLPRGKHSHAACRWSHGSARTCDRRDAACEQSPCISSSQENRRPTQPGGVPGTPAQWPPSPPASSRDQVPELACGAGVGACSRWPGRHILRLPAGLCAAPRCPLIRADAG